MGDDIFLRSIKLCAERTQLLEKGSKATRDTSEQSSFSTQMVHGTDFEQTVMK